MGCGKAASCVSGWDRLRTLDFTIESIGGFSLLLGHVTSMSLIPVDVICTVLHYDSLQSGPKILGGMGYS